MLSQTELYDTIRKAKNGDNEAKELIFNSNTPLIKSIIKKFRNKGIEYDDLYQIACIGFIKAINNFDESFNVRFSTYCVPMVIGEIKRYMRDNGAIKVSRNLKILANKINRFIGEYQAKYNVSPKVEYLSKVFNVTEDDVVLALDSAKMPLSIYDRIDDDDEGQELIDKIAYVDNEESVVNKIHLLSIIDSLNDREKKIIILRYFRDKTQSEIAEDLGVSQVQISRIENKIIEKIKQKF